MGFRMYVRPCYYNYCVYARCVQRRNRFHLSFVGTILERKICSIHRALLATEVSWENRNEFKIACVSYFRFDHHFRFDSPFRWITASDPLLAEIKYPLV